ncbi:hypothetical protein TSUD_357360 [Trifolium subterraneum]|uniref:Uncharacterized protein n=1 Tax=Trifolium subterraneum TaxID=3900 RepID=A0A2Z6MNB0_TRISU|nr:hypothetical protein TSUD_357360 [Trifolium subterraneum]
MDAIMFSPHSRNVQLKSFHLKFRYKFWDANADCSTFDKWIEAAKQRRVEYLNLINIPLAPTTIFCCKTLVVLRLMSIRVANMFHCSVDLPVLKTLDLFNVRFDAMENLMRLISGCPVLENLKTSYVVARVAVTAGEYFKPLSKLFKAHINLFEVPLRAVYNVQFLTIFQMGKIHRNEEISSYYKGFPVFGNLTILQLCWWFEGIHDWDEVVKMLQNCPKLQTLKIVKRSNSRTKEGWKKPCHAPECVSSHLTTCKIEGYKAVKADFRFATYIMQNARLLQRAV